jgi:hypothetical protein
MPQINRTKSKMINLPLICRIPTSWLHILLKCTRMQENQLLRIIKKILRLEKIRKKKLNYFKSNIINYFNLLLFPIIKKHKYIQTINLT